MKNCNAFNFTHRQIFKTLTRDYLGGGPLKGGGGLCICTLCTFLRLPLHLLLNFLHTRYMLHIISYFQSMSDEAKRWAVFGPIKSAGCFQRKMLEFFDSLETIQGKMFSKTYNFKFSMLPAQLTNVEFIKILSILGTRASAEKIPRGRGATKKRPKIALLSLYLLYLCHV